MRGVIGKAHKDGVTIKNWSAEERAKPPKVIVYEGRDALGKERVGGWQTGDLIRVRDENDSRVCMFRILQRISATELAVEVVPD